MSKSSKEYVAKHRQIKEELITKIIACYILKIESVKADDITKIGMINMINYGKPFLRKKSLVDLSDLYSLLVGFHELHK